MKEIHQLVAGFALGDAISNEAMALRDLLRSWGFHSEIYSQEIRKEDSAHCNKLKNFNPRSGAAVIYHYSIAADEATRLFLRASGKKSIIYHNITPHHFFAMYKDLNPLIAKAYDFCKRGREDLAKFRDITDVAMADSAYNALELQNLGFKDVTVVPIMLDLEPFRAATPDPTMLESLRGKTNFIFTGRLAPNKCQEDVIRTFAWYHQHINPESRLILVGRESCPEYLDDVQSVAYSMGVNSHVYITGHVNTSELAAIYKSASIFLCMSEHEGFCVPLLESFIHEVPVLAYAASGVPYTMGDAGVLFHRKDIPLVAETAHLMISDSKLRERILHTQRRRLEDFHPDQVAKVFKACIERLSP